MPYWEQDTPKPKRSTPSSAAEYMMPRPPRSAHPELGGILEPPRSAHPELGGPLPFQYQAQDRGDYLKEKQSPGTVTMTGNDTGDYLKERQSIPQTPPYQGTPGTGTITPGGGAGGGGGYSGGGGYGGQIQLTDRQQAALDTLMGILAKNPMDLQSLLSSDAAQAMKNGLTAQFRAPFEAARADLAARGMLRGTAAAAKYADLAGNQGQIWAGQMIPQLFNMQMDVNKRAVDNALTGLSATQGAEGWSLGQERDDSALTGMFRGNPTETRRQFDANNALNWWRAQKDNEMAQLRLAFDKEQAAKSAAAKGTKAEEGWDPWTSPQDLMKFYDISPAAANVAMALQKTAQAYIKDYDSRSGDEKDQSLPPKDYLVSKLSEAIRSRAWDEKDLTYFNLMIESMFGNKGAQKTLNDWRIRKDKGGNFLSDAATQVTRSANDVPD